MYKALLLTAGFGDGHHRVAEALASSFCSRSVQTYIVDCYRSNHPAVAAVGEWVYEWATRYTPAIYGASYNLTASLGPDHRFWRLLSSVAKRKLLCTIQDLNPDIILQLFPDHILARMDRPSGRPFIGTVLTDFSVHGRWFHRNVDRYFIPDYRLMPAVSRFADSTKCTPSGIPVRAQFDTPPEPGQPTDHRYVLVATGGRGVFPALTTAISMIRHLWPEHDIYVLCGRNEQMRAEVAQLGAQIHGLPFQENIAPWLCKADFVVTKAGGVTMAECLVAQAPMVLYKPQPGQEMGNARFAEQEGAAVIAGDAASLKRVLMEMAQPNVLERMRTACADLRHADAARQIVDTCLQSIQPQS